MSEKNNNSDFSVDAAILDDWQTALKSLIYYHGKEVACQLLNVIGEKARQQGVKLPYRLTSDYINTIAPEEEPPYYPGDLALEARLDAYLRWNAMAMVIRAGKVDSELGGHIASFASAATLYQIGFYHFFHRESESHGGDLVYMQGHSSPGIYALAFLQGCLDEKKLSNFRQEAEKEGLSSYPHPWLMPDFWQFPTVSMGLGPIQGIYQARFLKYLHYRELLDTDKRKVWVFCGDGEMDEPESLGAINIASKEGLDNLIFVINCNLQRLDGPVRGNSKIVQELEGIFRGAGWNVIKVLWDQNWDSLFAQDEQGELKKRLAELVDGQYQKIKANDGAYKRQQIFGGSENLLEQVKRFSDEELEQFNFGGHDSKKVYAAYQSAINQSNGRPTVILAKTTKGYGMGKVGQAQNTTHQQKKLNAQEIKDYRDWLNMPIDEQALEKVPFVRPDEDSAELRYLSEKRKNLGGSFPHRRQQADKALEIPKLDELKTFLEDSKGRELSTTMAFVRILNHLMKDKNIKERIVPIIPDECRTFGMEGMFRQFGIYSHVGQLYEPVDSGQLMYYREDKKGQVLEEGLTEAGAFCSWLAAATAYSNHNFPMIPFYIYYSMFGHQRIGDLAWAAGDSRAKGFLLGAISGKTTLPGEGLQHQDGHSHLFANTIANCKTYDPTFMYELAVIIRDGLDKMYVQNQDIHYYITIMNENYEHPAMPKNAEQGIIKGLYLLQKAKKPGKLHAQLLGCGTILKEVMAAAEILFNNHGITVDIWSAPSFNELAREAQDIERWNRFHPESKAKETYVGQCLSASKGPIVAATDYVRAFPEQIRAYLPDKHYVTLGTDGFGRSDTRQSLRHFFEIDRNYIAYTVIKALVDDGAIASSKASEALKALKINPKKPNPINS